MHLQITSLKERLEHLRKKVLDTCPQHLHLIPPPSSIGESKLGKAALTSDNCNAAQKVKRLSNKRLGGECHEVDCHNHMRNTFLCNPVEKALSKFLTEELKASLETIDPILRVKTLWIAFARAYDKEFSLAANYPKGHGHLFLIWLRKHYPGILLYHVESTHGTRQDILYTSSLAMFINRKVDIEFLAYCLEGEHDTNILQRNLYVLLTSNEMVAQGRLLSIIYLSMMLPLRWLAGKTHTLAEYGCGVFSMGRALDIFYNKLLELKEKPSLFFQRDAYDDAIL